MEGRAWVGFNGRNFVLWDRFQWCLGTKTLGIFWHS